MALADVLSAVRELVLNTPPLTGERDVRRLALSKRFPKLDQQELDDLASIPPKRLEIYTNLIFAGEREMLRWAYPKSLKVIDRMLQDEGDERMASELEFELARELHRFKPWASQSVRELAANFQDFVNETHRDWLSTWPGLKDLVDFERIEVEVFYALDFSGNPLVIEKLSTLSVGDLMTVTVARPPYVALRAYDYDVLDVLRYYRENESLPDPLPSASPSVVVCGRNPDTLMPHWLALETAAHHTLDGLAPEQTYTINDLAQSFLESSTPNTFPDEQAAFASFFEHLAKWATAGILLSPQS